MTDKDNRQLIITGILVFILVLAAVNGARKIKRIKGARKVPRKAVVEEKKVPSWRQQREKYKKTSSESAEAIHKVSEPDLKKIGLVRDPFVLGPKAFTVEISSDFSLNGILWDEKNPQAIINNTIVGVGDEVGGSIVLEITQDKVILNDGARNFKLKL